MNVTRKNRCFILLKNSLVIFLSSMSMQQNAAEFDFAKFKANYPELLLKAVRLNNIKTLRELLLEDVNPNIYDANVGFSNVINPSPLMWAVFHGNDAMVQLLLNAGADIDYKNSQGISARDIAIKPEIIHLLQQASIHPQAKEWRTPNEKLTIAVRSNNIANASEAFQSGANPNSSHSNSNTPLFFLAFGHAPMVKLFLAQPSFNPNLSDPNVFYNLPVLSMAISDNRVDTVKLLVADKRIDLNLQDGMGNAPLDFAIKKGNKEIINLLISKGARANKYQAPPPPAQPQPKPQPMVGETFIPEVYAALGLQPNTRDAYAILNLKADSSDDAIKKRYKELTFQWHPDKNIGNPLAGPAYSLIKNAYEAIAKIRGL